MGEEMTLPAVPVPPEEPARPILAALSELVVECTQLDPTRRPSMRGVLDRLRPLGGAAGMASSGSGPI